MERYPDKDPKEYIARLLKGIRSGVRPDRTNLESAGENWALIHMASAGVLNRLFDYGVTEASDLEVRLETLEGEAGTVGTDLHAVGLSYEEERLATSDIDMQAELRKKVALSNAGFGIAAVLAVRHLEQTETFTEDTEKLIPIAEGFIEAARHLVNSKTFGALHSVLKEAQEARGPDPFN